MTGAKQVALVETRPFVTVLTLVRDLGRARRDAGTEDPEVVGLGARAHAALMWLDADTAGDFVAAQEWLDKLYAGLGEG